MHIDWTESPPGLCGKDQSTCCPITSETYDPKNRTVCGEVDVALQRLRKVLGATARLDGWRTPYLGINPRQYDILHSFGVRYDSSLSTGDTRTGWPVDGRNFPMLDKDLLHGRDIVVFPISIEDGIGWYVNGKEQRLELSQWTLNRFMLMWRNTLRNQAQNGGIVTQLVHPSFGVGVGPTNLACKIEAVRRSIREAKSLGMRVEPMADVFDFWRGRIDTRLRDLRWNPTQGYSGRIVVGPQPAPRLTLQFGDRVQSFKVTPERPFELDGDIVTFPSLAKGEDLTFIAK